MPELRTENGQARENVQRSTPNVQRSKGAGASSIAFDLEERLPDYAAEIIRLTERLPHPCARFSKPEACQPLAGGRGKRSEPIPPVCVEKTSAPRRGARIGQSKGWHPFRVRHFGRTCSGGVAALNPRLMADSPSGCIRARGPLVCGSLVGSSKLNVER